jgi:hypothetical protein
VLLRRGTLWVVLALGAVGVVAALRPQAKDPEWAHLPGEWDPVPGASASCAVRVARHPARDVRPLAWVACEGRPGCLAARQSWTDVPGTALDDVYVEPVVAGPGGPYLLTRRSWPAAPGAAAKESWAVVQTLAGEVLYAEATHGRGSSCISLVSLRSGGITQMLIEKSGALVFRDRDWGQPFVERAQVPLTSLHAAGPAGAFTVIGDTAFVPTFGPDGSAAVDLRSGVVTPLAEVTEPRARPGGALVVGITDGDLRVVRPDGAVDVLVGRRVAGAQVDHADDSVVWVETSTEPERKSVALWRGEFVRPGEAFDAARITSFHDEQADDVRLVVNAGLAVTMTEPTSLRVTRLRDAQSWRLDAPPGLPFVRPLWVDTNEVWVLAGTATGTTVAANAVVRLSLEGSERAARR